MGSNSQIMALIQIFIDPYFRTIDGFIHLIEKEFINFGHKFADRLGQDFSIEKKQEEFSPIFIQFMDCVYQILIQNTAQFQFNVQFLLDIVFHSTSGKYGNFLFNSNFEKKISNFEKNKNLCKKSKKKKKIFFEKKNFKK